MSCFLFPIPSLGALPIAGRLRRAFSDKNSAGVEGELLIIFLFVPVPDLFGFEAPLPAHRYLNYQINERITTYDTATRLTASKVQKSKSAKGKSSPCHTARHTKTVVEVAVAGVTEVAERRTAVIWLNVPRATPPYTASLVL